MAESTSRPSALSRFSVFLLFSSLIAIAISTFWVHKTDLRVDDLQKRLDSQNPSTPPAAAAGTSKSGEITQDITARLTFLENQQGNIAATAKGALEQMNFIFVVVAGFFGLFSAFSAYRQLLADGGQERREQEMLGLVGTFRHNISVISDLIETLQQAYSSQEKVEKRIQQIDQQIVQIDKFKQRTEQSLREKVDNTNLDSFALFRKPLDRQSFKSEEMRGKLQTFSIGMSTLERTGDVAGLLSPFIFFCRALHYFNVMQYEPAAKDFEEARKLAIRESAKPTLEWYGDFPQSQVLTEIARMLGDCTYHLGIIYYNLGRFSDAVERFQDAVSYDHLDFRSRIYIPELMFFAGEPFARIRAEYEAVFRELDGLSAKDRRSIKMDYSEVIASLRMREGNIYLPKRVPLAQRAQYRGEENAQLAAKYYRDAFEQSSRIEQRQTLTEVFASFSLGQALEHVSSADWGQEQPFNLFRRVFHDLEKQVVFKTEPILLVQMNYVLAICSERALKGSENPRTYLARAREHLQRVPGQIRVFSPINKVILSKEDLLMEMDLFESSFAEKQAYATA